MAMYNSLSYKKVRKVEKMTGNRNNNSNRNHLTGRNNNKKKKKSQNVTKEREVRKKKVCKQDKKVGKTTSPVMQIFTSNNT